MALASSPPAAQAQTEVWSATLTVRAVTGSTFGCSNTVTGAHCTSNLSEDAFTHASTDYEIARLHVQNDGRLAISFDTTIATGSENLILDVAGTQFAFQNANTKTSRQRIWNSSGLSWSPGDTIAVKLLKQTGVWSGTMTTGDLGGDHPQIGWAAGIGSLDYSTFYHGGSSYTIDHIGQTSVFGSSSLDISLTSGGLDASDLTLHVDGEAFAFSAGFYNPGTATWFWTNTGLSWEAGDTVALSITQSAPLLVSNTGQAHDASPSINHSAAQQFSTGSYAGGYDLASVGYWIVTKSADSALTVTLRASVSGTPDVPGDVVHTFTSPTLVAGSLNVFTAPDGATLSADTDYFLVMEETAGAITMRGTASAAEDTGSHTGFSIADTRLWCNAPCGSSDWNSVSGNVLQIIVSSVISATPPSPPDDDGADPSANNSPNAPVMTIYPPASVSEGAFGLVFSLEWDPGLTEDVTVMVEVSETGNMLAAGQARIRSMPLYAGPFIGAEVLVQLHDDDVAEPDSLVTVRVLPGEGYTVGAWTSEARGSVKVTDDDQSLESKSDTVRAVLYPRSALDPDKTSQYLLVDWRERPGDSCASSYDVSIQLLGDWGWLESGDPISVDPRHRYRNAPPLVTFRHHGDYGSDVTEEQVRVVCNDGDGRLIGEVVARQGTLLPAWPGEGTGNQGALLPKVTLSAETAAAEGAALEFTLTRSGPTEEALGVDVRVSETGAMLAVFPSRAVIPAGQDSATFAVLTLDDEAVEADSVVTAAIAEDAERYTVGAPFSASVTVMDDDRAPLTAEFQDAPASHDGEDAFALRIAFSEAVAVSYRTLRDHALEVTGGRVTRAKRVDGRSDLWRITIEPDSDAGVTVVLPVTDDCDAQGAVCTGDGSALSNRLELTIPGPVAEEETQQTPPENSAATGAPAITGTAQVGETLTADTSGIADADGLDNAAFSYQWLADDADIQGATGSAYTLQDADEGKAVTVKVSFADDAGNGETLTSAATVAIEATVAEEEPVEPPPAPTNLTAVVNADGSVTLTWEAPDDDSVTGYLILRRRPYEGEKTLLVYVENTGTTATTFTDIDVTAGTQHVYRVKAVNEAGAGDQSNYVNVDP